MLRLAGSGLRLGSGLGFWLGLVLVFGVRDRIEFVLELRFGLGLLFFLQKHLHL